ncbi:GntR family transcriptional regulator [Cupriavidus basilensis]|nr:GntR family transcriptional regulator [Cupriavidus basilensis]
MSQELPALPQDQDDQPLSQRVYQAMLSAIISGQLKPGEVVNEIRLAQELGVSRTPVHTAIRELVKDGLITQEANRRPVVARFSREDIREVFDMRKLLESEAARIAAAQLDRVTLKALSDAADAMDAGAAASVDDTEALVRWADFDDNFHLAIADACGSKRLREDILRYRLLHHGLNQLRMRAELIPQALAEHRKILDALAARDGDAASRAMQEHLHEWQAYYMQRFPL